MKRRKLSLSQTTNYSSKLKRFADNRFRFDENGRKFYNRVENTMGKGEIAISTFPTVFSKDLYCRHVWERAKTLFQVFFFNTLVFNARGIKTSNDNNNKVIIGRSRLQPMVFADKFVVTPTDSY